MKSKLPVSRAKTAYGLLSDIAKLALEEPKRMAMGVWRIDRDDCESWEAPDRGFPACGTVGCIAGWTYTLRKPRLQMTSAVHAQDVLGLTDEQAFELFEPYELIDDGKPQQTKRHAKAVARHIAKFQKKYRAQLLAKKVR